uniref:Uncharacterized protein n=1 Tax=Ditylum brightwellii TaxID=49249 RepID=A0A7S4VUQ5_9STRA
MADLIDAETKDIIIKKTWCHGQAVMPIYGIFLLWWFISRGYQPLILVFPAIFLPYWCFLSYRSIFVEFSYRTILIGGAFVEVSHAIVFSVAILSMKTQSGGTETSSSGKHATDLLLCIAAGLFFIETLAFLGVVTALRPRIPRSSLLSVPTGGSAARYQDIEGQ